MRIYDITFYTCLCGIITIAMLINVRKSDISFHSNMITLESYPVLEKTAIIIDNKHKDISSLNITRLKDNEYLLSYISNNNIHAIQFFPNRYSTSDTNGKWSNVAISDKTWGSHFILTTKQNLLSQIKQRYLGITSFILQKDYNRLYLIANIAIAKGLERSYIFDSGIDNLDFRFYTKPDITAGAGLGYIVSNKFLTSNNDGIAREHRKDSEDSTSHIIPFDSIIGKRMAIFGIFDSNFNLTNTLRPNNIKGLKHSAIIKIPDNYDINTLHDTTISNSYSCILAYSNNAKTLQIQPCHSGNALLDFDEVMQSDIDNIESFKLSNLGYYPILIYTDNTGTRLNLAIWNGNDFTFYKQIDKDSHISQISLISYGSYTYVAYYKESNNTLNVAIINEKYLQDMIASLQGTTQ